MAETKQTGKTWQCKCPQTWMVKTLWCSKCGMAQPKAK